MASVPKSWRHEQALDAHVESHVGRRDRAFSFLLDLEPKIHRSGPDRTKRLLVSAE